MKISKKIVITPVLAVSWLTGCSTFRNNVGDNSLDYQQATALPPVQLPVDSQARAFVPLYQVPQVGQNTLTLENEKGKRFELPKPIATKQ